MAIETECQTPGCYFSTHIDDYRISICIDLSKKLNLNEEEAELLEKNLHNAIELCLARFFI